MRIFGYICSYKDFSFSIPIYSNDEIYYYHVLSERYRISEFVEANVCIDEIIPLTEQLPVMIGEFGFVVFIGQDRFPIIGRADSTIINVSNYLNHSKIKDEAYIRLELNDIVNCIWEKSDINLKKYSWSLKTQENDVLIEKFGLAASDLENIPKSFEKLINVFLSSVRKNGLSSFIPKEINDLYLIECDYISAFDKEVIEKAIKPTIIELHKKLSGNIIEIPANTFSSILPAEKHYKKLPTIFLYPYFYTNERKNYSGIIPWGKQTHFSFLVYKRNQIYKKWLKENKKNQNILHNLNYNRLELINKLNKLNEKQISFEFNDEVAIKKGKEYIINLINSLNSKSGIYTLQGFIFDELLSDFSFKNNLQFTLGRVLKSQIDGVNGIENDFKHFLEKTKNKGSIIDDLLLTDPGDIFNSLTFENNRINTEHYAWMNLAHGMDVNVGIGFSIHALLFMLKNRNWERIESDLQKNIVNFLNEEESIIEELRFSGININSNITELLTNNNFLKNKAQ